MLGAVEEDVAETALRIVGEAVDEVQREAVAHPDAGVVVPVVGPRLLGGTGSRHGEHAGDSLDGADDALAVAGLGGDTELAELHLAGGLAEQLGGEALAGAGVAPDELVGSALRLAAAVAAPEEEHVVACVLGEDDGEARRDAAREDVGDVACGEVAAVVVYYGFRQLVGAAEEVGTARGVAHGAGLRVAALRGHRGIGDEDDVVVVESAAPQGLVDAEHVGLVAVVDEAVGALHEHGILVGQCGIYEVVVGAAAGLLAEVGVGLLLVVKVEPGGVGVGGAPAGGAEVLAVDDLVVDDLPAHVGRGGGGGVGVAVEGDLAGGADEVEQLAALQGGEVDLHGGGIPGGAAHGGSGRAGGDGDDGLIK